MRKQEFTDDLRSKLSALPPAELEERLSFYEEIIDDRMEEGLSEEEAVAAIGSADEIAEQIIGDVPIKTIVKEKIKPKRRLKAWEIVLLVLGSPIWFSLLVIVPLSVAISLYAVLWSVIVALWAAFASVVGSAVGVCIGGAGLVAVRQTAAGLAMIGAGLVCAGLSVFLFFGCSAATKGSALLTKKSVLGVKKLFFRKETAR